MSTTVHTPYVEPIRKSIRVRANSERAFSVFTAGMTRWWLRTHTVNPSKSPIDKVVMEPRAGGKWYEVGADSSECQWGQVLVWEPPHRLVLAWHLDASFQPTINFYTEIEVRFSQIDTDTTEVTLEHRQLEKYGEAAGRVRGGMDTGWSGLLQEFADATVRADSL
jgi:uncharacterized protein YndB with AHSA1/START domain